MTWKEIVHFWLTGERPEEKRTRERVNMLLDEQYRLIREALQEDMQGNKEAAQRKRDAAERVSRQIGRIDAGTEDVGI